MAMRIYHIHAANEHEIIEKIKQIYELTKWHQLILQQSTSIFWRLLAKKRFRHLPLQYGVLTNSVILIFFNMRFGVFFSSLKIK
jgi:hypothetical protein